MEYLRKLPWPPEHDQRNDRLRCFYPKVITHFQKFSDMFKSLQLLHRTSNSTRISVRVVVDRSFLQELKDGALNDFLIRGMPLAIEGAIPIDHVLQNCDLVYLAWTNPITRSNSELFLKQAEELARLKATFQRPSKSVLVANNPHYLVDARDDLDDNTIRQISSLFSQMFELYPRDMSPEQIKLMLKDHVIVTAYSISQALLAVLMIECASMDLEGVELKLFKFKHIASFTNGFDRLHRVASLMIYRAIEDLPNPTKSVVFAEARSDLLALQAALLTAGMTHVGTMNASFRLKSAGEKSNSEYTDAQIWYLPVG